MKRVSKPFSVALVKDGVTYEIVSDIGSVTIASNSQSATLSANLSFYRRQGNGAREAYSCCYTVFRKKGTTYTKHRQVTTKAATGYTGSMLVTEANADAVVVCIYDAASASHSGYLAELEIPVRKNGDSGAAGKDAAMLVFEPATVYVACDADGTSIESVDESVAFFIEIDGTRYTPDDNTATAQKVGQDIDYTFASNKTVLNVDIGAGHDEFEGYIKVTAQKTLSGKTYTGCGCLPVVSKMQGEPGSRGPQGAAGPMLYLAGEYKTGVDYGSIHTSTACPVVHYVDGTTDQYWYPTDGYVNGSTPSVANGWAQAERFDMIVTKVLFTQFAKLGGFVVSGDFFISKYGELTDAGGNSLTLTQRTDSDGFTHWQYEASSGVWVDAYTHFRDYDPMATGYTPDLPLAVLHRDGTNGTTKAAASTWAGWKVTGKTTSHTKTTFGGGKTRADSIAVGDYFALIGIDTGNNTHRIVYQCTANTSTTLSGKVIYYDSGAETEPMFYEKRFRPMKVVNAATGEEWFAGGKVHVGADGDVTVEGTIKAKNLYRNLCLFSSGGTYSNQWHYVSGTSDWISRHGLSEGDYIEITDEMRAESDFNSANLVATTYDADIVQMVPNASAGDPWANMPCLPRPEDFPGKVVEFNGWSHTTSEQRMIIGVVGSGNKMCNAVSINSDGKFEPATVQATTTILTGSTFRFMSMKLGNVYYWTKLNEK